MLYVMVPEERVNERAQLHPSTAEFSGRVAPKAADVRSDKRHAVRVCASFTS